MYATKSVLSCCMVCQVPLSVLPYFRFLSEEAQRNVMSQLIDNFQTTSITKRTVASTATAAATAPPSSSSASSPEGLAFMRSPTFAKVTHCFACQPSGYQHITRIAVPSSRCTVVSSAVDIDNVQRNYYNDLRPFSAFTRETLQLLHPMESGKKCAVVV